MNHRAVPVALAVAAALTAGVVAAVAPASATPVPALPTLAAPAADAGSTATSGSPSPSPSSSSTTPTSSGTPSPSPSRSSSRATPTPTPTPTTSPRTTRSSASPTPELTTQTVPPEATAAPNDPTAVKLPKVALAALTTVPDYDIDPLLLAGLRKKLAQAEAHEKTIAAELAGQQGQLVTLSARADELEAEAARSQATAVATRKHYEQVVNAAYMSQSGLSPAVDALLSPTPQNPWEVMYSSNLMTLYANDQSAELSSALAAMRQAKTASATKLAEVDRARESVAATQRQDTDALRAITTAKQKLQARITEVRRELAARQAAQRATASSATSAWKGYLSQLGVLGVRPPTMAQLRDPAHLPKALRTLTDRAGKPQAGVAQVHTAHGALLVLPKEVIEAVGFAFAQLGKPYVWAATGPNSFDCSGLTMAAYRSAGVTIPRISWDQYAFTTPVDPGDEMPGDLVYFAGDDGTTAHPGHVAMVIDPVHHLMIQAPQTGDVVKVSDYSQWGGLVGFGRVSTSTG